MKKVFARIGMELLISDEEAKQLIKECGSYSDGTRRVNNELDINEEFAKRFIVNGTITCDSYIPEDAIEDVEE